MRIGCLPNMRNIYLWRRKSKKNEKAATKANEFSKPIPVKDEDKLKETEEFWLGEYVDSKSQIHDSSTSIKNESLNEKEVIHSEPGDELYKLIYDSSSANKNGTQAKQESIQDQAIQEYEGVQAFSCDGPTAERRGTVSDGFNKVKTFDLRGVQSSSSTAAREEKQLFGPDIFQSTNLILL
ncbi:hypothetical protein IGI04_040989 [Brassica rapa subsp. trilocularis]|uniref:Uncharacterized protein n=2 Tax=Brassica campestris TaxID=3711 RepID=A0A3P6CIQ7_BRACM|nr:hypothetical protein IGI04_040989 [Brassica rapa subsp. trilocularis]CAG7910600.1 unnamed protein product [Brassica rapa]VDD18343.1 unnamed protein product [Brassica rapa]